MRRPAAAVALAALVLGVCAPGPADADRTRKAAVTGKAKLRGKVKRKRRGAPRAWRTARARGWATQAAPQGASPPSPSPSPQPTATATPSPAPPSPPPPPESNPRSVSVGSTEFAFTLSQPSVRSGDVRVQFDNSRAEDPHDLVVTSSDGRDSWHFGELAPGEVTARTLPLRPGDYELVCPLTGHEAAGMRATLSVSE